MTDNIQNVAIATSRNLADLVTEEQIAPTEVVIGAVRGIVVFWMGCTVEGSRTEGLKVLQQVSNEEIENMIRGIANGMVQA